MAYQSVYFIVHGHGYVTDRFPANTVISVSQVLDLDPADPLGDAIYDVTVLYTPIYGGGYTLADDVGSRIIVTNMNGVTQIPDGEYTLVDEPALNQATFRGIFSKATPPLPGAIGIPFSGFRIEDFYKFSNTTHPSWITGSKAQSRWLPLIVQDGLSLTLGEKVDVIKAGFASVDGLSIEVAYKQDFGLNKMMAYTIQEILDTGLVQPLITQLVDREVASLGVLPAATKQINPTDVQFTLENSNLTAVPGEYLASDPINFTFRPVMIDRESMIITNNGPSGTNQFVDVFRGVLRTRSALHAAGTLIVDGPTSAIGSSTQVLTIDSEALCYAQEEEQFFGVIENLDYQNNQTSIVFELSDISITGFRQKFAAKLGENAVIVPGAESDYASFFIDVDSEYNYVDPSAGGNWRWAILDGKVAIRLFNRVTGNSVIEIQRITNEFGQSVYRYLYQGYCMLRNSAGERLDDYYVFASFPDSDSQNPYIFPELSDAGRRADVDVAGTDADYGVSGKTYRGITEGTYLTDAVSGERSPNVIQLKTGKEGFALKLGHLFEPPEAIPGVFQYSISSDPGGFRVVANDRGNGWVEEQIPLGILVAQILTSGDGVVGGSPNGPFDVLPYNVGLDIPIERIDLESLGIYIDAAGRYVFNPYFDRCRAKGADKWANINFSNVVATEKDLANVAKWLTENFLEPLGVVISRRKDINDGLFKVTAYSLLSIIPESEEDLVVPNTIPIQNNDLIIQGGRNFTVDYEARGTDVIESYTYLFSRTYDAIVNRRSNYDVAIKATPAISIPDSGETTSISKAFSYIQAKPIVKELKYPPSNSDTPNAGEQRLGLAGRKRVSLFSQVLPKIKLLLPASTTIPVGNRFILAISNVIDPFDGVRKNIEKFALCISRKLDVLSGIVEAEFLLVGDITDAVEFSNWAPTAGVLAGSIGNTINTTLTDYTADDSIFYPSDAESFDIGDFVLLYDENFVLKSTDALGLPDPRDVTGVGLGLMKISSAFTTLGVPINPAAGDIIVLATKALQPTLTQVAWSYYDDNESIWVLE